tara:strand:- start:140 stop:292 length:153 start_codon:yes stop_codon:yes gene_type:complete
MANVWKMDKAIGTIARIAEDHVVIKWDSEHDEWYYTSEQAENIEVINESR